jgi:hypothetical protein
MSVYPLPVNYQFIQRIVKHERWILQKCGSVFYNDKAMQLTTFYKPILLLS